jgi:hypothetical protein
VRRLFLLLMLVTATFAASQVRSQKIDFVGCPSDGMAGYLAPPRGASQAVNLTEVSPREIAYYKGDGAPGAFAPRGWSCHVWYGSGGGLLLITPEKRESRPGSAWPTKTSGQAIELSFESGENSGRYDVVKYAMLFFPKTAAKFIEAVNSDLDMHTSQADLRRFAKDSPKALSNTLGEFVTPAKTEGLGTERYLKASAEPISGVVSLDQSEKDFLSFATLRIRMSPSGSPLNLALLRLNKECMREKRGCSTR